MSNILYVIIDSLVVSGIDTVILLIAISSVIRLDDAINDTLNLMTDFAMANHDIKVHNQYAVMLWRRLLILSLRWTIGILVAIINGCINGRMQ